MPLPCDILPLLEPLFPLFDADGDQSATVEELEALAYQFGFLVPDLGPLLELIDRNDDGVITVEEVRHALRECHGDPNVPGEGEAGEGETDPPAETERGVFVRRSTSGNGFYVPGRELVIETVLRTRPENLGVSALALVETLPERWAFTRVLESGGATIVPEFGDHGAVRFVWTTVPEFPVRVRYSAGTFTPNGPQAILGHAVYRLGSGAEATSPVVATPLGQGWGDDFCHDGDYDHDWTISLSELLRIVQYFNLGGLACDTLTEDGFAPGNLNGLRDCLPHSGDYNGDWILELEELLRIIQFYNSPNGAYFVDDSQATEDGFAPGVFVLK